MQELAGDKRFKVLVFLVLILVGIALGSYARLAYVQARQADGSLSTISVTGMAETFVKPDIATFSFSVGAEEKDAAAAQQKSADAINAITGYLKEQGIEEKDIKTINYSLNPKYEYTQVPCTSWGPCPGGQQNLVGYTVDQTVSVKVRAIEKAGDLIAGVGTKGATNVGGIEFTIDDTDAAKEQVRKEAIEDAKEKAERLAENLGVRLGSLVNYYEDVPGPIYNAYGGDAMMMKSAESRVSAPEITPGEQTLTSNVTLIYKVR